MVLSFTKLDKFPKSSAKLFLLLRHAYRGLVPTHNALSPAGPRALTAELETKNKELSEAKVFLEEDKMRLRRGWKGTRECWGGTCE